MSARVSTAISKASGLKDRGAKQRTELYFLKNTTEPAILLEICFVDSKADVELYQKNFKAICAAIAEVLAAHLGYANQSQKEKEAKVMFNDVKTIPTVIIDGKMHVPVRDIADLLGLNLVYNNESKIAKLYEVK